MSDVSTLASRSPVTSALSETSSLVSRVLKMAWLPILLIHVSRAVTQEFFTYGASLIQARGREELGLLATAITLQFLVEMAWSAVWAFIVIDATRRALGSPSLATSDLLKRLNQLVIEGVRSIAAILYRVPLLLIPALVEFIRLMFVPHVVLLDRDYEAGRVDALKRSRELTRGRWTLLIFSAGVLLGVNTYVEIVAQGSTEVWMWEEPLGWLITTAFTFATNLYYEVFLVALFLKLSMIQALRESEA